MALDETRRTLLYAASSSISVALSLIHRAIMDQPNFHAETPLYKLSDKLSEDFDELSRIIDGEAEPKKVLGAFDKFLRDCVNESINGGSER